MLSKKAFSNFSLSDLADYVPKNKAYLYGGGLCLYAAYYMYSFRPKNFPPGPKPIPFLGTIYKGEDKQKQEDELVEMGKKYGPVFSASKFSREVCVFVNDYEIYRDEIKPLHKIMVDRMPLPLNDVFNGNDGIVFSNGKHWVGKCCIMLFIDNYINNCDGEFRAKILNSDLLLFLFSNEKTWRGSDEAFRDGEAFDV